MRAGGGGTGRVCSFSLCLELQAEADLVAAGVDVLAVEESGQSQLDSCRKAHVSHHVFNAVLQLLSIFNPRGAGNVHTKDSPCLRV